MVNKSPFVPPAAANDPWGGARCSEPGHPSRAKAALYLKTGAIAVDMESHIVGRVAVAHGLPVGAIRVIADPAPRAIPASVLAAVHPNGTTDIAAMIWSMLKPPTTFPRSCGPRLMLGLHAPGCCAAGTCWSPSWLHPHSKRLESASGGHSRANAADEFQTSPHHGSRRIFRKSAIRFQCPTGICQVSMMRELDIGGRNPVLVTSASGFLGAAIANSARAASKIDRLIRIQHSQHVKCSTHHDSGGVKHLHDMPPFRFLPSPTSAIAPADRSQAIRLAYLRMPSSSTKNYAASSRGACSSMTRLSNCVLPVPAITG